MTDTPYPPPPPSVVHPMTEYLQKAREYVAGAGAAEATANTKANAPEKEDHFRERSNRKIDDLS